MTIAATILNAAGKVLLTGDFTPRSSDGLKDLFTAKDLSAYEPGQAVDSAAWVSTEGGRIPILRAEFTSVPGQVHIIRAGWR